MVQISPARSQGAWLNTIVIAGFGTNNVAVNDPSDNIFLRDVYSAQAGNADYYLSGQHVSLIRAISDGGAYSVSLASSASDVSILDSHFEGAGTASIIDAGSSRTRLVSNIILPAPGSAGLSFTNTSRPTIDSNRIIGTSGTIGIDVESGSSELTMSSNEVVGFATAVKYRGNTGVLSGNILSGSTTGLDITAPGFGLATVTGNDIGGATYSVLHNSGDRVIYNGNRTEDGAGNYKAPTISAGSPLFMQPEVVGGVNRWMTPNPIVSTVPTGTAPLVVSSTTQVANLQSATAGALAANGTNCSAGQFPLGVDASGNAENCTALPTTISGTANQIAVSAATGAITVSIPSSPTLPGTTTGAFSGTLTGNVTGNVSGSSGSTTGNAATATALAGSPTQCTGGAVSTGITTAGNANCTSAPTTVSFSGQHAALGYTGFFTAPSNGWYDLMAQIWQDSSVTCAGGYGNARLLIYASGPPGTNSFGQDSGTLTFAATPPTASGNVGGFSRNSWHVYLTASAAVSYQTVYNAGTSCTGNGSTYSIVARVNPE